MNKVGDVILDTAFTAEASRSQYPAKSRLYSDIVPIITGVKNLSLPRRILANIDTKSAGAESVMTFDTLSGVKAAVIKRF
jgi:hypothetical protein